MFREMCLPYFTAATNISVTDRARANNSRPSCLSHKLVLATVVAPVGWK